MSNTSLLSRPELSLDTINLILSYCSLGDLLFISLVDKGTSKIVQKKLNAAKFDSDCDPSGTKRGISFGLYKVIYNRAKLDNEYMQIVFSQHCEHGNLEYIKLIYSKGVNINPLYSNGFKKACLNGHLHVAQWFVSEHMSFDGLYRDIFNDICQEGHLEVAKWLEPQMSKITQTNLDYSRALLTACMFDKINIVKWLVSRGTMVQYYHINKAIFHGNTNIVKFLLSFYKSNKDELYYSSCIFGNLEAAELLYSPEFDHIKAFKLACCNNMLTIAKWLFAKNPKVGLKDIFTYIKHYNCSYELTEWLKVISRES